LLIEEGDAMKIFDHLKALLAVLLLLFTIIPVSTGQDSAEPNWTPPSPRLKAKTSFAPRPFGGDNIFKGEAETWLADAIKKIEVGVLTPISDKSVIEYVSQIGKHLVAHSVAPKKKYEFIVLDDENVNAMNMGGGRIYINLGMLRTVESEDELAGVLAHEIAHDAFGHAPKAVTRQLFWMKGTRKVKTPAEVESALQALLAEYEKKPFAAFAENLFGFSRFNELEADRTAFYNTYKAGYNPYALDSVLKRMEREIKKEMGKDYGMYQFLTLLFGSHPPTGQRSMAISWESNFVKMPSKDTRHQSSAFEVMKTTVSKL
jgi:predicted Zn-dependent protease